QIAATAQAKKRSTWVIDKGDAVFENDDLLVAVGGRRIQPGRGQFLGADRGPAVLVGLLDLSVVEGQNLDLLHWHKWRRWQRFERRQLVRQQQASWLVLDHRPGAACHVRRLPDAGWRCEPHRHEGVDDRQLLRRDRRWSSQTDANRCRSTLGRLVCK